VTSLGASVTDSGNLARSDGPTSPLDADLAARWRGLALESLLGERLSCPVIVINDAAMAALGCTGLNRELMVTARDGLRPRVDRRGQLLPTPDVGAEERPDGRTFDQTVGEEARRADEQRWHRDVVSVLNDLVELFAPPWFTWPEVTADVSRTRR
jgi:hypothetical protein